MDPVPKRKDLFIFRRGRRYGLKAPLLKEIGVPISKVGRRPSNREPFTENKPKHQFTIDAQLGYWKNHLNGAYYPNLRYGYERNDLWISRGNARTKKSWSGGGNFEVAKIQYKGNLVGPTLTISLPKPPFGLGVKAYTVKTIMKEGLTHPPNYGTGLASTHAFESNQLIQQYEATGRARTDPGKPLANTAQAIAELYRDGFKLVGKQLIDWKRSGASFGALGKALGGEWLNLQFGVFPTVRDFVAGAAAIVKMDAAVAKLKRESGKTIRRRTTLKDTTTVSESFITRGWPFAEYEWDGVIPDCVGTTNLSVLTIVREKVWYVARYKYTMQPSPSPLSDLVTRAKLAGLVPSASLAWELLPWSWLADWFGNIGDVMKNMSPSAADNLVTLHSYLMKETETRVIITKSGTYRFRGDTEGPLYHSGPSGSFHNVFERREIRKIRVGGRNPYGFYFGWADLSTYQQSLLAALGLSRRSFTRLP